MIVKKEIVAVGMSGGVDSTMAAYLLKEQGYAVLGITMKIWQGPSQATSSLKSGCYGPGEAHDIDEAQRECERLGIPHHTIDLTREYVDVVLKDFSSQYLAGRTPNPCVLCNHFIKFGALLERARASGIAFDRFATGHYARISRTERSGRFLLRKALDLRKDQSYFLYRLQQQQLSGTLFPLGEFTKQQVKELAKQAGFADVADQPESQDFIDQGDYQELFTQADIRPGRILDLQGKVLGNHSGIFNFTVGQRRGLHLGGGTEPLYVLRIDVPSQDVIVGPRSHLAAQGLSAGFLNWIALDKIVQPMQVKARLRSRGAEAECEVIPQGEMAVKVHFNEPQYSATLGQSIVFYDGDVVLGGGIIQKVERMIAG